VAILVCGCLPSVRPFYTDTNVTELPWVEGKWLQLAEDGTTRGNVPWVFESNAIHALDDKGRIAVLEATYFSVNKITFVDTMTGGGALAGSDWAKMHLLPIHQLAKVERFGNRLVLTPMDYEWVKNAVKTGELDLRHETVDDDDIVFTCSPEDWEKFLVQYGSDTNVFSGEVRYSFTPEEPPPPPPEEAGEEAGGEAVEEADEGKPAE